MGNMHLLRRKRLGNRNVYRELKRFSEPSNEPVPYYCIGARRHCRRLLQLLQPSSRHPHHHPIPRFSFDRKTVSVRPQREHLYIRNIQHSRSELLLLHFIYIFLFFAQTITTSWRNEINIMTPWCSIGRRRICAETVVINQILGLRSFYLIDSDKL